MCSRENHVQLQKCCLSSFDIVFCLTFFINFSAEGYIRVDELLQHKSLCKFSVADVERVVATNEKQRFKLRFHTETKALEIKANQGHSIQLSNIELKLITKVPKKKICKLLCIYFMQRS